MAMVLRQTLVGGHRIGLLSVAGNTTGLLIWGIMSAFGLAAIFTNSPVAYDLLKYAGVAYLVFVGGQTLWLAFRGGSSFAMSTDSASTSAVGAYRTGLITNLTNVKAAVFAVAFVPSFIPAGVDVRSGVLVLGLVWCVVSASTYSMIIMAVQRVSHLLASDHARRRLTFVSGVGILFLAAGLLFG